MPPISAVRMIDTLRRALSVSLLAAAGRGSDDSRLFA
jgi:hypothetical protein